jgi:hypothetical protein
MSKKFDPAPNAKHVAGTGQVVGVETTQHKKRDRGVAETFATSDPVGAVSPAKSKPDAHPTIIEDDEHGPRDARHPS